MRVFLDANILFSASFPKSQLAEFLNELACHADLFSGVYAKKEAERNIAAKEPGRLADLERLANSIELIPDQVFDLPVKLAQKDRLILCGAIAGKADYLLTGDKKDFGQLFEQSVHGVKIVTVQILLEELIALGIVDAS
jgi:predicted nucleic acid-binding protein